MTLFYVILALAAIGFVVYFLTKKKGLKLPKKPEGPVVPPPPPPPPPPEIPIS